MRTTWRDEFLDLVKAQWHHKSLTHIADDIGVGKTTLYRHIKRLGLTPPTISSTVVSPTGRRRTYRRRVWSIQEDEYITQHYNKKSLRSIARKLKRTEASIYHRAHRIGLAFAPQRHLLSRDDVALMLGINVHNLIKRYAENAAFPMPIVRNGRFIQIDEFDFREWLKAGHIISFDRATISRELWRMYDEWDAKTISSTDVYRECQPIGEALRAEGRQLQLITIKPVNQHMYLKDEIYTFAYQRGNRIPPWSSPRFLAIKAAWDTEFVLKSEVIAHIGASRFSKSIAPHLTTTAKFYAKRSEVCQALRDMRRSDLVRQFQDIPITWQEMMSDYEKRSKQ